MSLETDAVKGVVAVEHISINEAEDSEFPIDSESIFSVAYCRLSGWAKPNPLVRVVCWIPVLLEAGSGGGGSIIPPG